MIKQLIFNDVYIPLLEEKYRYLVLFGGAGSGKSVFAAQKVVLRLTTEQTHRILVVRKTAVTLRESVFKLLKDQIAEFGIANEFLINKTDKTFLHIPTGNEIICVGLDDPEKLKSITGITSVWVEEPTELNEEDFDQLDLRLRGETANYKQILLTFNPVDERHWLKRRFEDNKPDNALVVRTTYEHNHFIDAEYKTVLEQKSAVSPNFYRIYKLGEWGKPDVKNAWAHNFSYDKHVSKDAVYNPNLPVYFSLDFNVSPMVCLCLHHWRDAKGMHMHFFKEIILNPGDVYKMVDTLKNTFPPEVLYNARFTGDATQRKRTTSTRDNIHDWAYIANELHAKTRLDVPKANPNVATNRNFINLVLALHPDLKINDKMVTLINELQFTEAKDDGGILKDNRLDDAQKADALDCFRYANSTYNVDFTKQIRQ